MITQHGGTNAPSPLGPFLLSGVTETWRPDPWLPQGGDQPGFGVRHVLSLFSHVLIL